MRQLSGETGASRQERCDVASLANKMAENRFEFTERNVAACIGLDYDITRDADAWKRMSLLIEPHMMVDDVYDWARGNLEGYDEPEWTLFSRICDAIVHYKMEKSDT